MSLTENLQSYVAERIAELPGIGVASYAIAAVCSEDQVSFADGVLRTDGDARVTATTPFHICSCSKAFTALAFSKLVEAGIAQWDASALKVVPELQLADSWIARHCSFRDLAGMRLGLSRDGIAEWGFRPEAPVEQRLSRASALPFETPFRDRFSYSNVNYIALACATTRLAGMSFAQCLRQLVFEPAGLHEATLESSEQSAWPHLPHDSAMVAVPELTGVNSQGSARVHLSARDASAWLAFNIQRAAERYGSAAELFQPQSLVRATGDTSEMLPSPWAYGFGWFLSGGGESALLHHGGGGRGWRSMAVMEPQRRRGVMVMLAHEGPLAEALAFELLDLLAGKSPADRVTPLAARTQRDTAARNAAASLSNKQHRSVARGEVIGRYGNAATGIVRITRGSDRYLRFAAQDAPAFDAILEPLDDGLFEFRFENPALMRMPADPLFQLRFDAGAGGQVTARTTYFGDLDQVTVEEAPLTPAPASSGQIGRRTFR
ncbi:MAG TPA: serine hydrolase domain-containing protein [Povalibacter sp.]|nr:serine hydrolase domain-containing protein [Povalibacter sp.]